VSSGPGVPPCHRFTAWEAACPGIVAGITGVSEDAGAGSEADYGLKTGGAPVDVMGRYRRLTRATGMTASVVARQVHGTRVADVSSLTEAGSHVMDEADGLVTCVPGVLLAVTAADCVPIFLADVRGRGIGLLHAGWRGAAAGILERGVALLQRNFAIEPGDLSMYLGPAICGSCYEVGSEVLRAFGKNPSDRGHLDLRLELTGQAVDAGVPAHRVTLSAQCTRCGPDHFHSHRARASDAGRMAAFLGLQSFSAPETGSDGAGRELR
jgi:YfiH family protein